MSKKKVLVGMSGGVDSSVTAYLLKQQGYDVYGAYIVTLTKEEKQKDIHDAQMVCDILQIPFFTIDAQAIFKEKVIDYFVAEYQAGRTPNPCMICNRHVKWASLLHNQQVIDVDYVATGHYANISKAANGRYSIKTAKTATKDQTYMLFNLTQKQLAKTMFPLGNYQKTEVREMAKNISDKIAVKSDSQEICFIADNDYINYIEKHSDKKIVPGNFVDQQNKVLGKHSGIIRYTIGQRRGLEINLNKRLFVTEIRPETNEVVLGDAKDLLFKGCVINNVNYMQIPKVENEIACFAKVRFSQGLNPCTIRRLNDAEIECIFDTPQRAITKGQGFVAYQDEYILLGGIIDRIIK